MITSKLLLNLQETIIKGALRVSSKQQRQNVIIQILVTQTRLQKKFSAIV